MQPTYIVGGKKFSLKLVHCLHVRRDLRNVARDSLRKFQFLQQHNYYFLVSGRGRNCLVVDLAFASLQGQLKFILVMLVTLNARCNMPTMLYLHIELLKQRFFFNTYVIYNVHSISRIPIALFTCVHEIFFLKCYLHRKSFQNSYLCMQLYACNLDCTDTVFYSDDSQGVMGFFQHTLNTMCTYSIEFQSPHMLGAI